MPPTSFTSLSGLSGAASSRTRRGRFVRPSRGRGFTSVAAHLRTPKPVRHVIIRRALALFPFSAHARQPDAVFQHRRGEMFRTEIGYVFRNRSLRSWTACCSRKMLTCK